MNKLIGFCAVIGVLFVGSVANATDVDEDTYWQMGTPSSGAYNWYLDASTYDFHVIQNGSSVFEIDADGESVRFANDIVLIDDTASEFKISDTTTSEDLTFLFSTNKVDIGSDTAVADVDFNTLDVISDAYEFHTNAEFLDSPTDGEICFNGSGGTNNEDLCLDMETTANEVALNSNTSASVLDTGTIDLELGGGATALEFTAASSSVVYPDNSATALVVGSTGLLDALTYVSTDDNEYVYFKAGRASLIQDVTGAETLDASDCGKTILVTAGIDGSSITLPAISSTPEGCELKFMYNGADGGALVDISPNSADAIHGSCTLAASVVEFSGTDDADIGLTKATANTGDTITLVATDADWYVLACAGIWANN